MAFFFVARASRPCGSGDCWDHGCSSHLPDLTIPDFLQGWRADIEMQVATATGGYRREVSLLRVPGPCGPGGCNAAPPGLVMWVNRESFTKPTLWYGSPARAEWLWMLNLFKFAASTFSLQARRANISPAGGDSHRWGGNLLFFFLLFPPSDWFWCVRDRGDGFMPMFDDPPSGEVTSPCLPCDRLTHPTAMDSGLDRRHRDEW